MPRSLPPREAWIEINPPRRAFCCTESRFPHGKRGLKLPIYHLQTINRGRFPHGKRGLKLAALYGDADAWLSLPPREAWIEITISSAMRLIAPGRFPHGKRGLKSKIVDISTAGKPSLPPREAWIEIMLIPLKLRAENVASPTGSVD